MSRDNRGLLIDTAAAVRARELLVGAQQPLIQWLGREYGRIIVVMMLRDLSRRHEIGELMLWLAESENLQSVFRRIRVFMVGGDAIGVKGLAPDVGLEDGDRVHEVLLRSIRQVTGWIEDERNTAQLLSVLRDVGGTVDMGVVVRHLERDASSGYQLAQRAFQSIRLLMPGGRPNSGVGGLAGLAARSSLM